MVFQTQARRKDFLFRQNKFPFHPIFYVLALLIRFTFSNFLV